MIVLLCVVFSCLGRGVFFGDNSHTSLSLPVKDRFPRLSFDVAVTMMYIPQHAPLQNELTIFHHQANNIKSRFRYVHPNQIGKSELTNVSSCVGRFNWPLQCYPLKYDNDTFKSFDAVFKGKQPNNC